MATLPVRVLTVEMSSKADLQAWYMRIISSRRWAASWLSSISWFWSPAA